MELALILKILVLVIGFYMSWNIGANDVSNAMGTSVGSGALTLRRAVILAAILEFSGAFFVGGNVSETMQRGLIDTDMFLTEPNILILGMSAPLGHKLMAADSFLLRLACFYNTRYRRCHFRLWGSCWRSRGCSVGRSYIDLMQLGSFSTFKRNHLLCNV